MLAHVEIETKAPVAASIVMLHGLGADGHDLEPVARALAEPLGFGVRILLPHAPPRPISVYDGWPMAAWYDIRALPIDDAEDEAGIRQSAKAIRLLIEREIMRGVPAQRIVLGGFSQGAAMSLFMAPRLSEALAGVLAFSGYMPLADRLSSERSSESLATPFFLAHGEEDDLVPIALGMRAFEALKSAGYRAVFHRYPAGHVIPPAAIADAVAFVQNCLLDPSISPTSM